MKIHTQQPASNIPFSTILGGLSFYEKINILSFEHDVLTLFENPIHFENRLIDVKKLKLDNGGAFLISLNSDVQTDFFIMTLNGKVIPMHIIDENTFRVDHASSNQSAETYLLITYVKENKNSKTMSIERQSKFSFDSENITQYKMAIG